MRKRFLALPIAIALSASLLSACVPNPNAGAGTPYTIQQRHETIVSVDVVQGDTARGEAGVLYVVDLVDDISDEAFVKTARLVSRELAAAEPGEWVVTFRAGNRGMGVSHAAYGIDFPTYALPAKETPKPTETPVEGEPEDALEDEPKPKPVDIYRTQLALINEISELEGVAKVVSSDSLRGSVEVTVTDYSLFEDTLAGIKTALNNSGVRHRGNYEIIIEFADITETGTIAYKNQRFTIGARFNESQDKGIGEVFTDPVDSLPMFKSIIALEGVSIKELSIRTIGGYEEIFLMLGGKRTPDVAVAVNRALGQNATRDAYLVVKNVRYEYPD